MIKYIQLGILTIIWLSLQTCAQTPVLPQNENFNLGWQFYKSSDTAALPSSAVKWEEVNLPHTANLEQLTVKDQWQGICFYRKDFTLKHNQRNKSISLQFDGAMNVADVWLNGKKMTHHVGGYLLFVVDLSDLARFDSANTILVRLDNRDNPTTGPKPLKTLDFNMYGGLYRGVSLIVKEKVHLSNPIQANLVGGGGVFFTTNTISKQAASFQVKAHIENQTDKATEVFVKHQLIDKFGNVVVSLQTEQFTIESQKSTEVLTNGNVETPQLWSPATPNLYTLKTEVYANGKLTDLQTNSVGLRTIRIVPSGLWLNGEKTFLRGVNRHQEYPYVGYALSDAAQYRDAYKIKQAGFDFVRCSHYPMSPAFLSACDELGIMVLDAILGWQYFGGNAFETLALRSGRELIRRDRNHPCVLAWELSINETTMPKSFTDSAQIIAHQEYPYSGCYSAGWMRQSYDIYIEARQHRHGLFPEKPLIVSEYGDWEYYAQNAGFNQQDWKDLLEEERTSRQPRYAGEKRMLQQALNIQEAHNDNLSTHAFADAYWVMFDYNRGMAPEQEYSGIMDIFRLPKFSYYFIKSQRNYMPNCSFAEPVVFIASYWQPGESKSVSVFSNCEEIELFIDGKSEGRRKPDKNQLTTSLYHAPFTFEVACSKPGTLKAVGYMGGKIVKEQTVTTPEKSDHITLQVDESGKTPERNDIFFVYAHIMDKNNTIVPSDSSSVSFKVDGAQVIGQSVINAQAGTAIVLIRSSPNSSTIRISATSKGIKPSSIDIQIN